MEEHKRYNFLLGLSITLGTIVIGLVSYLLYSDSIGNIKARCDYAGWSYASGDVFKSSDGCNSCACSDGQVTCTAMACVENN